MKSSFKSVLLCLLLAAASSLAQDQPPSQTPAQTPGATAPAIPPPATPTAAPAPTATLPPPREVPSIVNTGSGFSIEPIYWRTQGHVLLRRGTTNTNVDSGDLDYPRHYDRSIGLKINIPVSKNATIRGSYFQTKSDGGTIAPVALNLFKEPIARGDVLGTTYSFAAYKISYDYLTYFWKRGTSELRLKTLWEIQRISLSNEVDDFVVDSTGALVNINPALGEKSMILPTLGLGFEHTLSRHFRWEARASGFALPHRSLIGDGEAAIAVRFNRFELLGGGRWLHFKTTPRGDHYNSGTLYGPYVALRFYWKKQ